MLDHHVEDSGTAREAVLAEHPTLGYIKVLSRPPNDSWKTITVLSAHMPAWMERLTDRTGGDAPATAAFLCGWAARAVVTLPVTVMAASGRALVARPQDTFLCVADGGWVTGIAPVGARVLVDTTDALRSRPGASVSPDATVRRHHVGQAVSALMAPIIDALAPASGMTPRALWWLVTDAVAAAAVASFADVGGVATFINDVCDAIPATGPRRPALHPVWSDGRLSFRPQRISCCFAYRTPAGQRCEDCPVGTPRSGRSTRFGG